MAKISRLARAGRPSRPCFQNSPTGTHGVGLHRQHTGPMWPAPLSASGCLRPCDTLEPCVSRTVAPPQVTMGLAITIRGNRPLLILLIRQQWLLYPARRTSGPRRAAMVALSWRAWRAHLCLAAGCGSQRHVLTTPFCRPGTSSSWAACSRCHSRARPARRRHSTACCSRPSPSRRQPLTLTQTLRYRKVTLTLALTLTLTSRRAPSSA